MIDKLLSKRLLETKIYQVKYELDQAVKDMEELDSILGRHPFTLQDYRILDTIDERIEYLGKRLEALESELNSL